ncbi:uncharacterized protein FIBRA_00079 [Fibroporia radiculosa]|uniref:Ig-like domain-containing protein n=1 Tax=Fibroporia radiculosa TaxID=599839 RepID=J7RUT7_9APHY|nr:uncharacterized protein FIBRA_00079 [Fibroporia radiculosa]CCL98085.1 predicted protein [Fibroporia radiculosa]
MSSNSGSTRAAAPPPAQQPLVPESFIDVPSQRLYILSLGALLQAIKAFDFLQYSFFSNSDQGSYGKKWFLVDLIFCTCLARLRIPRLRYSKSVVVLQVIFLWILDGLLFGGITFNVGGRTWMTVPSIGFANPGAITSTPQSSGLWSLIPGLGTLVGSYSDRDAHLLGQHTVRMSPISTAHLNPYGQTFCLSSSGDSVLIPILLNNTNPAGMRYTLFPLGYVEGVGGEKARASTGRIERVELSAKELKAIETARLEKLQLVRLSSSKRSPDIDGYDDDYDEEDEDEDPLNLPNSPSLQRTQSLAHIRLNKPGKLQLDHVFDSSNVETRLVYPSEVTVVPCPRAHFAVDSVFTRREDVRCAIPGMTNGAGEEVVLDIDVFGVPPLSLRWYKEVGGRRESFMVEGIEDSEHVRHRTPGESSISAVSTSRAPANLRIPLAVSLDALGTHSYILESVTDSVGNVVHAGTEVQVLDGAPEDLLHKASGNEDQNVRLKTHRSITVLRRPGVSFKHCGPGSPTSLLVGADAPLTVSTIGADELDAPWDIDISYQSPLAEDESPVGIKRNRPWSKGFQTEKGKKDLILHASAPGEYHVTRIKGRYCEGDILSPDTCKVIERPLPVAEIEWKRIYECSGDIGVSASLVLHGTPPFQVYYHMQRDNEPSRELSKTFASSRGEITIQPERSGHYVFRFTQISDANYKKVNLKGPSIDQVVHPPASAEFSNSVPGGRGKKKINSCSGSQVDVDIDLRGTGPWNLAVQIVGPKGSEIMQVPNITTSSKTLQLPIPKAIDRDGGSFEIDLVSVEDAYGCKRALSVPGLVVNVRRVQPTARFYGKQSQRHVTILENEEARLPLRLTGDGPWQLRYRRADHPDKVYGATLSSPNDELLVGKKGLYELLEVADSQCPGSVVVNDATYRVDHVPRPSARLSPEIQSTFESFNGSHILPPICEGVNDNVDLELTGRPPFQIMYNVARGNDLGGTKILDQPTFSSIQSRTSFQLHTSEAARIYYEVKQIGDAAYPLAKNKDAIIPRSERLLFEQQVLRRPSARFKNRNRISYCLSDTLHPRDSSSPDGMIVLEGSPPFSLDLSIRNLATSEVHTETVILQDSAWKLDIPSYTFHSIGPHLITIESVQDSSRCEQVVPGPSHQSIWVDVAETAAIIPFDRREDFCVGDAFQFQLEGTPPWTIGYRINGRSYTQEAKISPFTIVQQQPGEFVVTSIAHQQKMCKTAVTDLRYNVHTLPSARVGHGKRIIQDIHEGDQAEILFTLIGEPPFTFTYQRAELTSKKGMQGKVLETHTVSGVTTKEYSIFSALEGF